MEPAPTAPTGDPHGHDHPHPHPHDHPHPHPHPHPHHPPGALVRSPHLALTWSAGRLTLSDGLTGNVFAVSPGVVAVLDAAGRADSPDGLAERAEVGRAVIDSLAAAGIVVPADELPAADHWSTHELIVQRTAGGGRARAGLDLTAMPPMRKGSWSGRVSCRRWATGTSTSSPLRQSSSRTCPSATCSTW